MSFPVLPSTGLGGLLKEVYQSIGQVAFDDLVAHKVEPRGKIFRAERDCILLVIDGSVRVFFGEEGFKAVYRFLLPGDCFYNYEQEFTNSETDLLLLCCERTTVFRISYEKMLVLADLNRQARDFLVEMALQTLDHDAEHRRIIANLFGMERVEYLVSERPDLVERFRIKDLSGYLGIAPETYSRLYKKLKS